MTEQKAIQKHSKECIHRIEVIEEFMKTIPNDKECVKNIEVLTTIVKILEEVQQYQALGTVEELREAREKQRKKKPILNKTMNIYFCPVCERRVNHAHSMFCSGCGQAIDWSEEE